MINQPVTSLVLNPRDLFERVHLASGMHVADFGAGRTGHLVFPAAKIIGEHGVVYAVDILPDVLSEIKKRAALNSFLQIQPVWADIERVKGVGIPKQSLDMVFVVNVLHNAAMPELVLTEADRLLKNKGRLIVVDWVKSIGAVGPSKDKLLNFKAVIDWARTQDYAVQEDFSVTEYSRGLILFKHD